MNRIIKRKREERERERKKAIQNEPLNAFAKSIARRIRRVNLALHANLICEFRLRPTDVSDLFFLSLTYQDEITIRARTAGPGGLWGGGESARF